MSEEGDAPADDPQLPVLLEDPRDQVIAWILEGQRDADIKAMIAHAWPDLDPVTLMVAAVDHFAKASRCDTDVVIGWGLEAYRDLYRRLIDIGDFAGAIKAVKELVALAIKTSVHTEDPQDELEEAQDASAPPDRARAGRGAKAKATRRRKNGSNSTVRKPRTKGTARG